MFCLYIFNSIFNTDDNFFSQLYSCCDRDDYEMLIRILYVFLNRNINDSMKHYYSGIPIGLLVVYTQFNIIIGDMLDGVNLLHYNKFLLKERERYRWPIYIYIYIGIIWSS